jgi:carboxyl-terminal processing protease
MARKLPSFLLVPSVIALSALLSGMFGPGVKGVAAAGNDDVNAATRAVSKVFALVEENFSDKVDPDRAIYQGAIPGMLRTLDPHSNFYDPRAFKAMREDQRGRYYGVGMQVGPRLNRTMVIAPFPGSPAYRAGLLPGDMILMVDDKSTEGLTVTQVADLLKGDTRGVKVRVEVSRAGVQTPIVFEILRDEIPRESVKQAFWVKPGIAHLNITQFNENTSHEMDDNLKRLGEANIKGLVLDLRDNPGGLLNEGVAVAERFLQKGQAIVSHRGRSSPERSYSAKTSSGSKDFPIVVLINGSSASAAEIVSGALQDHDRAWILGENSFGKGLVQTVVPLAEKTALALTTARYYTPSGRLIQRDYSNTSFFDYYYRKGESKNLQDVKMTDGGRTVYGGGGITPDEKFDIPKGTRLQTRIIRAYGVINFVANYFATRDRKSIKPDWTPDQGVLTEFRQFLTRENVPFTEVEFNENLDWIKRQLKSEVFISAMNIEDSRKIILTTDPLVLKAIDSMPKAKELLDAAKKMIVQRMNGNAQNQ